MAAMEALNRQIVNFKKDQRGTAILELAVVLPVLLTIGLGVMEFGNAVYSRHLIENGVRDGARYAAGLPYNTAATAAKNIALTGVTSGGTYRVSWWNNTNMVTVTYANVTNLDGSGNKLYRGGATIQLVTVSTDVAYQPLGFLGYLGLGSITLHASHEERLFGVR